MDPFLKQVARFLDQQFGAGISRLSVVFPSRRSGVFFNAYLNDLATGPILGPEVITINDLVAQLSGMQISDQISLILRLHRIYREETGHLEELDDFFFWGEILLNDFNDVDKYLLDADDLFQNISDLKEIESRFDYLTPGQKRAIELFWGNLGKAGASVNREKFLTIWNKLATVYHRFRDELLAEQVGYSGLVYRDLVEKLQRQPELNLPSDRYVFVGFNALNAAENSLFRRFKSAGIADFFWDYDVAFVQDPTHEAGLFIRQNLIEFPMPNGFVLDEDVLPAKKIQVVSVPGQVAQAQVVNHQQFLANPAAKTSFDDAALVLADENFLIPVVSAAGCRFNSINITMGYPLQNTPVYSLISQLIELQKNFRRLDGDEAFYYRPVLAVLNHQLLASPESKKLVREIHQQNKIYVRTSDLKKDELFSLAFTRQEDWRGCADYFMKLVRMLAVRYQSKGGASVHLEAEYLYQVYLAVQRLVDTLEQFHPEKISLSLFYRILVQHLQRIAIPFEGEPLSGLQVMGVLETRNLDFKKLVLFSVNEGKLPKTSAVHSFIPYNLRKAFGLPAYEEQDAMYAYYFYRLLHRAEEVVLVYDSSSDGLNTGEMSRYLFQMMYDSDLKPEFWHLDFDFKASGSEPISIPGTAVHQQRLLERYAEKRLSPSALNTYLDCKLKFYFRHVANIKETDELLEDVDPRLFGNLFHHAAELIYTEFKGKEVSSEDLKTVAVNKNKIGKAIHSAFAREYYKDRALKDVKITGKNILIAENLQTYLERMLENDRAFAPFTVLELEGDFEAEFVLPIGGVPRKIKLGGIVDRIDQTRDGVRIIDYKTGRALDLKFKKFSEFYDREKSKRPKEIFQTLVYAEIYRRNKGNLPILPTIYKIDQFFDEDFLPSVMQNGQPVNYSGIADEFVASLDELLLEMFSDSTVYDQTAEVRKCQTCPYNLICRRG
ncbi:PD-(D/E)XK nuclease family protein [Gaoshiqia sediminis]|uniref:PD-(D/E)XK nuclease family protein n=1 Tax=Gaoshiqia sediminis TaxID=2986998 RepID=A0AA41YCY6_9BACT|nr:PD-(D/E)XK nuclease family protein [Gaoshiqia sediminis]MCW0482907.1 PD-(D/E)XK nuclease family protein [Gaoshiqia sediminis]